MKYGCVVHSSTDLANSSSCACAGSRVSVTICCAGTATAARTSTSERPSTQRRTPEGAASGIRGGSWEGSEGRDFSSLCEHIAMHALALALLLLTCLTP